MELGLPGAFSVARLPGALREPWTLGSLPPAWVRERAAIEMWPGGAMKGWRRSLRGVGIATVSPVYVGPRLTAIELDGFQQELDWSHHSPLDHALREAMAHLQEQREPPSEGSS